MDILEMKGKVVDIQFEQEKVMEKVKPFQEQFSKLDEEKNKLIAEIKAKEKT